MPISEDEAYYWLWSQRLDWGFFDHPPMVAAWISAGYQIFQNELGVRLMTVLMNSLGLCVLFELLKPQDKKQFQLFVCVVSSLLVMQTFGVLATPDAPLLFFTILYLYFLKGFLEKEKWVSVLGLAVCMACLMYSKYHGLLVIAFTLIPIVYVLRKKPKFYWVIFLSLILYVPHLIWLFHHDFIPIRYHFLERSADEHFEFRKLFNYLGMYFLGASPLLSFYVLKSVFKFKPVTSFEKSLHWLAIAPGIFFFFSIFKDNVQPQWLLISFIAMGMITYLNRKDVEIPKLFNVLSILTFVLLVLARIYFILPAFSPFEKNKIFAERIEAFNPINPIFEKYQEASIYQFYHPQVEVNVHRTLGNRHSQFSMWKTEEDFYGKEVSYISPWVRSDRFFKGFKNRMYYLKEIKDYQSFDFIQIETPKKIIAKPNEIISVKIKITNHHQRPVQIGGDSEFALNINYYQKIQYEIVYSQIIQLEKLTLKPNESKEIEVHFKNCSESGNFKACFGIQYAPVGTSYLSKPILIEID